jgi:hypothetical protein
MGKVLAYKNPVNKKLVNKKLVNEKFNRLNFLLTMY